VHTRFELAKNELVTRAARLRDDRGIIWRLDLVRAVTIDAGRRAQVAAVSAEAWTLSISSFAWAVWQSVQIDAISMVNTRALGGRGSSCGKASSP